MTSAEKFAGRVYFWAAMYGFGSLALAYFQPVPDPWHLTHLAFVGTAMAFQGVFFVISRDPVRYLPLLPVTFVEKLAFGVPAIAFVATGRNEPVSALFGAIDLFLMVMFVVAWMKLRKSPA